MQTPTGKSRQDRVYDTLRRRGEGWAWQVEFDNGVRLTVDQVDGGVKVGFAAVCALVCDEMPAVKASHQTLRAARLRPQQGWWNVESAHQHISLI